MQHSGVGIELGGKTRYLALDLNASIAVMELTGQDLGEVLNRIFGAADAAVSKEKRNLERVKAIRLIVRGLLASSSPELEDDPHSLQTVGAWLTVEKMGEIPNAIAKLMESVKGPQEFEGQLAPFVPTPKAVVARMIEMADLKKGDEVIDLGAGDGRLLFAAVESCPLIHAYGVEAHGERFAALQSRVRGHKDNDRITLRQGDIRQADLNGCNVVFLYLLTGSNAELKPKLLAECKPGTRIISHDFGMPDWEPEETVKVECEDRPHTIHMWKVPAR